MANPHNRKPIYFRSTNPGLANVDEIASRIFQFDETGNKPAEVLTGAAVMPPQQALNEILVWSDSNTLGYGGIPNAPMFWGDGGVGGEKILQMINHVAGRKSGLQFYELEPAKTWILSQDDIYTNLLPPLSGGVLGYADITVEVRNSQNNFALDSFYFNQGLPQAVLYGTHGDSPLNNPVAWLPMTDGDSQTITNVPIVSYNNMPSINWQMNFWYSYNGVVNAGKYFTYYHNGVHQPRPNWYTSTSISSGFTAPNPGLQNGDEIKFIISDVPGVAPFTAGGGSSAPASAFSYNFVSGASGDSNYYQGTMYLSGATPNSLVFGEGGYFGYAPSAAYNVELYLDTVDVNGTSVQSDYLALTAGDVIRVQEDSNNYIEFVVQSSSLSNLAYSSGVRSAVKLVLNTNFNASGTLHSYTTYSISKLS
jgi:hypothetical protein